MIINEFNKNNWSTVPFITLLTNELKKELKKEKSTRFYSILLALLSFIQNEKVIKSFDPSFILHVIISCLYDESILYDYLFTHSFTHSLTYSLLLKLIQLFTHSLLNFHSLTHSFTHFYEKSPTETPSILFNELLTCYFLLYRDSANAVTEVNEILELTFMRIQPSVELVLTIFSLIPDVFILQLVCIIKKY